MGGGWEHGTRNHIYILYIYIYFFFLKYRYIEYLGNSALISEDSAVVMSPKTLVFE